MARSIEGKTEGKKYNVEITNRRNWKKKVKKITLCNY